MQQTMPLGESFRFSCGPDEYTFVSGKGYTSEKMDGKYIQVSVELARNAILQGGWKLLPSATLSDEESFTLAEKAVNAALAPVKEVSLYDVAEEFLHNFRGEFSRKCKSHGVIYTVTFKMQDEQKLKKMLVALNSLESTLGD